MHRRRSMMGAEYKPFLIGGEVLYFPMLRDSVATCKDWSGNGNDGTITGAIWTKTSKGKAALSFDGTDDVVVVTNSPSLTGITTAMTALIWVKGSAQDDKGVFAMWDDTGTQRGWIIYTDTGGGNKFRVLISENGAWTPVCTVKSYASSISPFDNTWHQIGFTWVDGNPTGTLQLIIDGVVDPSPTKTLDQAVLTLHPSTANLTLSAYYSTGVLGGFLNGIEGVSRLFNKVLSATEVTAIYNREQPWFV